ncbi:MAG TPA: hypothetical protein PLK24_03375, partial [Atribacter sp.]|nr:hypothetical protein [Atribacter sp.]
RRGRNAGTHKGGRHNRGLRIALWVYPSKPENGRVFLLVHDRVSSFLEKQLPSLGGAFFPFHEGRERGVF